MDKEQDKEQKKLAWMNVNFIEECKKMLALIEIQKLKVIKEKNANTNLPKM